MTSIGFSCLTPYWKSHLALVMSQGYRENNGSSYCMESPILEWEAEQIFRTWAWLPDFVRTLHILIQKPQEVKVWKTGDDARLLTQFLHPVNMQIFIQFARQIFLQLRSCSCLWILLILQSYSWYAMLSACHNPILERFRVSYGKAYFPTLWVREKFVVWKPA